MQQNENWDLWRRMLVNVDKALPNNEVSELLEKHYKYLHSKLVKSEGDEDLFNDTFLKLTYNYNSDEDFIDQYCYYFKLLKGAYYRDSKVTNWLVIYIEAVDVPDVVEEPEVVVKDDSFINKLKDGINAYSKKSTKTKQKNH